MYFWWTFFIMALFSVTYKPKNRFWWILGGHFFVLKFAYLYFDS